MYVYVLVRRVQMSDAKDETCVHVKVVKEREKVANSTDGQSSSRTIPKSISDIL